MIRDVIDRRSVVVCVGTGGVGKTTIAASIALAAARRGRRAVVLTIDPARALARAFGLPTLPPEPAPIPGVARLDAGMLDAKHAWDAFVRRHAPGEAVARDVLANAFYQQLSTSFAGSTEYMAIEETCRLAESGRYDLIVLDTPPAGEALEFIDAPERLDRVLDPRVARLLARPSAFAGKVLALLGRVTGAQSFDDVMAFFVALAAFLDRAAARTRRARELLRGSDAAFVLVAGPRRIVLAETGVLAARMRALETPLAAVVLNRVHAMPHGDLRPLAAVSDAAAREWIVKVWDDAIAEAAAEADVAARLAATLPGEVALAVVPEAEHDVHALEDLEGIAGILGGGVGEVSGATAQGLGARRS